MQKSDQFVKVGQVLKSNGTDGSLVIRLFDNYYESPRRRGDFSSLNGDGHTEPFWIFFDALPVPFFADFTEEKGVTKIIARLTDINSREDADELAGRELYHKLDADCIGEHAGDDSIEDMDLTGWILAEASADSGAPSVEPLKILGSIAGIERIPGNPLLVVKVGEKRQDNTKSHQEEALIPLHEDFVRFVDHEKKILGMSLPEGLV